jgi:hypothetical protein
MLELQTRQEEFLEQFTEEVILVIKRRQDKEAREKLALLRAKREVEIEKLRQRFSKYGEAPKEPVSYKPIKIEEKKEEIKPMPLIQPQVRKEEKKEEMIPSIIFPPQNPQKVIQSVKVIIPQKQQPKPPMKIITIPIPPQQPPLQPGEIDFGRLRFLVKDPLVTYIEAPGPSKNVIIKRAGVTTKTQITLSKEEILSIVKSFSEKARIPLIEGMLNARLANLEIAAIVTESANPSFILKKNPIPDMNRPQTNLQRPMMPFPQPGAQRPATPAIPPVNRPFTQPQPNPPAQPQVIVKVEQKTTTQ